MYIDLEIIKQVPIEDILKRFELYGLKQGHRIMYLAPWRKESNPSLSVDTDKNLWCDYGDGFQGGSNIDLIVRMGYASNWQDAAEWIENNFINGSTREFVNQLRIQARNPIRLREPALWVVKSVEIESPALKKLAKKRNVPEAILSRFCKEVVYANRNQSNETHYGIGFPNRSGGWAIRNYRFKGSISPVDISIVKGLDPTKCVLFEGFFDFLSYASEHPELPYDAVVLNSTSNRNKAIGILNSYQSIYGFLDNDLSGDITTQFFIDKINDKTKFIDKRGLFTGYNDYNDYWKDQQNQAR